MLLNYMIRAISCFWSGNTLPLFLICRELGRFWPYMFTFHYQNLPDSVKQTAFGLPLFRLKNDRSFVFWSGEHFQHWGEGKRHVLLQPDEPLGSRGSVGPWLTFDLEMPPPLSPVHPGSQNSQGCQASCSSCSQGRQTRDCTFDQ